MATKRLNFSVLERNVLLRLIEDNIEIVESKKNDGLTVRRKDEAWARIVSRFNAEHDVVRRTHRQLRKYWNNLKMRAKKSINTNGFASVSLPKAASARRCADPTPYRSPVIRPSLIDGHQAASTLTSMTLQEPLIKHEPISSSLHLGGAGGDTDRQLPPVPLEPCLLDEGVEAERYNDGDDGDDGEGGDTVEEEDIIDSDSDELGEVFHTVSDKEFRHETVAGMVAGGDGNSQWTAMDYARSEHEAKMALLTIQMETAHEQRELAREMREQTRQRHRLEMQVMEEKRRYRRRKMNSLPPHGQN